MPLEIIGTGFGRTGTMSLKLALEQLGFGKCYHMYELIQHPDELHYFENAKNGKEVDWEMLFQGYKSAVDFPIILFYKQLIAKYPKAKIIHTTRNAESWYKSFHDTILWAGKPSFKRKLKMMMKLPFSKQARQFLQLMIFNGKMIDDMFGKDEKNNREKVIETFNKYNEEVLNVIPKERTLIYNVKEGWEPLCKFLQVEVPKMGFPKVNSTQEFISNVGNA